MVTMAGIQTGFTYEAIIIGGSWGGFQAVSRVLGELSAAYPIPVIVILHRGRNYASELDAVLQTKIKMQVKEIEEKDKILPGFVYIAPANYHLLIEADRSFSLDVSSPVHYSRPSIDVTFESAAEVFTNRLVGIILTGANHDGAKGLKKIVSKGGIAIVQDPTEAESGLMPKAAIESTSVNEILTLAGIHDFLVQLPLHNHPISKPSN